MRRLNAFWVVLLAGISMPIAAEDLPKSLARQLIEARKQAAGELIQLAGFCEKNKAYAEARTELAIALAVHPESKEAGAALERLSGKKGAAPAGFGKPYARKRKAAHRKCVKPLAKVALVLQKKGYPDRYEQLVRLAGDHFPAKDVRSLFRAVWFDPYRSWMHPATAKKLKAGGEWLDGKWVSAADVKRLDREHATWKDPWVVSDDVHEVRTTLPYRSARQVLGHVAAFRRFFLNRFRGEWDLRPPKGKLPVIVTETRAELLSEYSKGASVQGLPPQNAAFYQQSNSSLNPCFVTLELQAPSGQATTLTLDQLGLPLQHEIAHQIAFEYSKYDYDRTRMIQYEFWCVEALANFLQYYVVEKGTWRLTHPRTVRLGDAAAEGAFAHCQANLHALPALEDFFATSPERFSTAENYHIAATVAYFLLEGKGEHYRRPFLRLLETVHKVKDRRMTLDRCFEGVDRQAMQAEFEKFVRRIKLSAR